MNFFDSLLQTAKQKLKQADQTVGGWLPGGGVPSPATRLVQQATEIIRNPERQLKNPKTYRAFQNTLNTPTVVEAGGKFDTPNYTIGAPEKTTFYSDPKTGTTVMVPQISTTDIFDFPDRPPLPAYEIHFAGPEGGSTRAEQRREYRDVGPRHRPVELFRGLDPGESQARSLGLRAQLGQALSDIPENSWIRTAAETSRYESRSRMYDRMTQGAFKPNPETNEILVYKAGPTTWYNANTPEKRVEWDPSQLKKQLKEEAIKKPSIGSLRETPGGGVVEAIARRFGGPHAQAALLLDDMIKQITGISPSESIIEASSDQLRRSVEQQQRMGVQNPQVWQNAPF
jgi:hypothetical protein